MNCSPLGLSAHLRLLCPCWSRFHTALVQPATNGLLSKGLLSTEHKHALPHKTTPATAYAGVPALRVQAAVPGAHGDVRGAAAAVQQNKAVMLWLQAVGAESWCGRTRTRGFEACTV